MDIKLTPKPFSEKAKPEQVEEIAKKVQDWATEKTEPEEEQCVAPV